MVITNSEGGHPLLDENLGLPSISSREDGKPESKDTCLVDPPHSLSKSSLREDRGPESKDNRLVDPSKSLPRENRQCDLPPTLEHLPLTTSFKEPKGTVTTSEVEAAQQRGTQFREPPPSFTEQPEPTSN